MKHFVTFWLLVVALFLGVTAALLSKSETKVYKYQLSSVRQNSSHSHQQASLDSSNSLLGAAMRNSRIRNTNTFQRLSSRILRSTSKVSRIKNSANLVSQKCITSYTQSSLKSALNLTNGYYLHQLCKLLIWSHLPQPLFSNLIVRKQYPYNPISARSTKETHA